MCEFHVIRIKSNRGGGTPFELVLQGEEFARERCAALNEAARLARQENPDPLSESVEYEYVSDLGSAARLAKLMGLPCPSRPHG